MKVLFVSCLLIGTLSQALAASDNKAANFPQMKTKALKHLETRISVLQETKTCINSAEDHKGLSDCRKKQKQKMRELMSKAREHRREFHKKKGKGKEKRKGKMEN